MALMWPGLCSCSARPSGESCSQAVSAPDTCFGVPKGLAKAMQWLSKTMQWQLFTGRDCA